jgi:GGDEF domain-containing protein
VSDYDEVLEETFSDLMKKADVALCRAKEDGWNRVRGKGLGKK